MPLLGSRSPQLSGIRYKLSIREKSLRESFLILSASRMRRADPDVEFSQLPSRTFGRADQLITFIRDRGHLWYFFALGSWKATRVARTRRLACPNEAVSVVTSVSEHARAHGLNPRNIHTGAPTRYYRGIIQTYLYPSPMTADMTCDRLRYRLHDMLRSLAPSFTAVTILYHPSEQPLHSPVFLLALPSMENMQPARRAARLHLCVSSQ